MRKIQETALQALLADYSAARKIAETFGLDCSISVERYKELDGSSMLHIPLYIVNIGNVCFWRIDQKGKTICYIVRNEEYKPEETNDTPSDLLYQIVAP